MTSTSAEKDGIFSDDLNAAVIFCRSWPLEFFIPSLSETCQKRRLEEEQKKEQANFVQTLMLKGFTESRADEIKDSFVTLHESHLELLITQEGQRILNLDNTCRAAIAESIAKLEELYRQCRRL